MSAGMSSANLDCGALVSEQAVIASSAAAANAAIDASRRNCRGAERIIADAP
jgi:hypothetical protein